MGTFLAHIIPNYIFNFSCNHFYTYYCVLNSIIYFYFYFKMLLLPATSISAK